MLIIIIIYRETPYPHFFLSLQWYHLNICNEIIKENWTAQYICITLKKIAKKLFFSQDIRIKLRITKYAMLLVHKGKQKAKKGTELCNQEIIKTLKRKKNYKYLQILKAESIIMTWKGQQKEIFGSTVENLIKRIYTWTVSMHKFLYFKDDTDRLHAKMQKERNGFVHIENYISSIRLVQK